MADLEERCYITFGALTQVLKAEKCLAAQKVKFWVTPIPREISADCGMCIMCSPDSAGVAIETLLKHKIGYENKFVLKKRKGFFSKSVP